VVKNIMVFNKEQAEKALPTKAMDGLELGVSNNLIQPLQGGTTESNLDETRRPSSGETYKAVNSPYLSVNRQLDKARKTLTRQQEEAAYKLARVHRHYGGSSPNRRLNDLPPKTASLSPVWYDVKLPSCWPLSEQKKNEKKNGGGRTRPQSPSLRDERRKKGRTEEEEPVLCHLVFYKP
jgi:hypothetical protein